MTGKVSRLEERGRVRRAMLTYVGGTGGEWKREISERGNNIRNREVASLSLFKGVRI